MEFDRSIYSIWIDGKKRHIRSLLVQILAINLLYGFTIGNACACCPILVEDISDFRTDVDGPRLGVSAFRFSIASAD